jgi:isoleucyl-tRNA synthetase
MINRNISVHLQDYPDVKFLDDDLDLIKNMDLVRSICSTALAIRDNKNLRVRLPLQSLTVIGKSANIIKDFHEIIAEEVNVKEINFIEDIYQFADLKLQINFKKIGAKFGSKIKEITQATKENNWQKIDDKTIEIAGIKLVDDEFELKLTTKNYDEKKFVINALPTNDFLVSLNIEITLELEDEGISRDIVRAVQQNRKDANLQITDHIELTIFSNNPRILAVAKNFSDYIKSQVLANNIIISENNINSVEKNNLSNLKIFDNQLEDGDIQIAIRVLYF